MSRALVVMALLGVAAAGCTSDDDASPDSTLPPTVTTGVTASTSPRTTAPVTTTDTPSTLPPTTVTPTTEATTTTTISEEELRAQIARDYQRSWRLRRELVAHPSRRNLDNRLARISARGSADYKMLRSLINELVELDERVVSGSPAAFRIDIEQVDLRGPSDAVVTICFIRNPRRIDANGNTLSPDGTLVASRSEDHVRLTPDGWLPDGDFEDLWQGLGVTECPPA